MGSVEKYMVYMETCCGRVTRVGDCPRLFREFLHRELNKACMRRQAVPLVASPQGPAGKAAFAIPHKNQGTARRPWTSGCHGRVRPYLCLITLNHEPHGWHSEESRHHRPHPARDCLAPPPSVCRETARSTATSMPITAQNVDRTPGDLIAPAGRRRRS